MTRKLAVSFEFFPPKTPDGREKLKAQQLLMTQSLSPDFFSVTYGAGGSTRQPTLDTVLATFEQTGVTTAPHLSCIGDSKAEIKTLLEQYQSHDIRQIVALRGDLPSGIGGHHGELRYAADLVAFIRHTTADHFHIEVAGYPEVHPEAPSAHQDMMHLKTKVDAGADGIITQYFFNIDAFIDFKNRAVQQGIQVPIVPGIMPITHYEKLARFSTTCGAEIPRWLDKRLQAYQDDLASLRALGHDVVLNLCEKLIENQIPGLHFYTLNQAQPSLNICQDLELA